MLLRVFRPGAVAVCKFSISLKQEAEHLACRGKTAVGGEKDVDVGSFQFAVVGS